MAWVKGLSPHAFCYALATKKGYLMRGKKSLGSPDPHRAGLQVLYDTIDGAITFVSHAAAVQHQNAIGQQEVELAGKETLSSSAKKEDQRRPPGSAEELDTPANATALVWLQSSLRIADNAILARAMAAGPAGLEVVVVWRHGRKVPHPAASFEAHAMRSLHTELRARGSGLTVLYAKDETEDSAADAVAAHAAALGVRTVVVDAGEAAGGDAAALVESSLHARAYGAGGDDAASARAPAVLPTVEAMTDDTLFPLDVQISCLPKSRSGGGGAASSSVLRWADWLKAAANLPAMPPQPPPSSLPPSLSGAASAESIELPEDSKWWGVPTLDGFLALSGAEISEAGALQLAEAAGVGALRNGRSGYGKSHLGERAGAGGVVGYGSGRAVPRPSYVSPFLRWGVLSPRQAEAAGVRRRDLLWRDFSRLCWRVVAPLRRGEPVTQVLPIDEPLLSEGAAGLICRDKPAAWTWTPPLHPPVPDAETPSSPPCPPEPPSWCSLLGVSEAEAFEAWCTGRTGAPLVDAGMIQLWATGWMPRRLRLLCAACLVEGLGLDWRLGRDWFAYALIDHDYAINECMWQNAGLVGIDPFYRGLQWDAFPAPGNDEYVEDEVGGSSSSSSHALDVPSSPSTADAIAGSPGTPEEDEDEDEDEEDKEGDESDAIDDDEDAGGKKVRQRANRYTRRWLGLPPLAIPPFPPALHAALARPRPALHRVRKVAAARRMYLGRAYQMGGKVSRMGLCVEIKSGEAKDASVTYDSLAQGQRSVLPTAADHAEPSEEYQLTPGAPILCVSAPAAGSLPLRDSMGSAADEIVRVGHLAFRQPPITHGTSWVAAKKAAVLAVAASSEAEWAALERALEVSESAEACKAAARRLLENRLNVFRDIVNPMRWTNILGRPLTQLDLRRVHPDLASHVDGALREIIHRLLHGTQGAPGDAAGAIRDHKREGEVWAATAQFLQGRIQSVPKQKEGRTPDLSESAAEAMLAVLLDIGGLEQAA